MHGHGQQAGLQSEDTTTVMTDALIPFVLDLRMERNWRLRSSAAEACGLYE